MNETITNEITDPLTTLDVRPLLAAGQEPLHQIMDAFRAIEDGHGLRLLAPFKPMPLLKVAKSMGLAHWMKLEDGLCQVLFWRTAAPPAWAETLLAHNGTESEPAVNGNNSKVPMPPCFTKVLDARDLEPPEPMIQALEILEQLPPKGVLLFIHHRFPRLLLEELKNQPITWTVEHEDQGVVIRFLKGAE